MAPQTETVGALKDVMARGDLHGVHGNEDEGNPRLSVRHPPVTKLLQRERSVEKMAPKTGVLQVSQGDPTANDERGRAAGGGSVCVRWGGESVCAALCPTDQHKDEPPHTRGGMLQGEGPE